MSAIQRRSHRTQLDSSEINERVAPRGGQGAPAFQREAATLQRALDPTLSGPDKVRVLQQTAGNRAVQQLRRQAVDGVQRKAAAPVIQRRGVPGLGELRSNPNYWAHFEQWANRPDIQVGENLRWLEARESYTTLWQQMQSQALSIVENYLQTVPEQAESITDVCTTSYHFTAALFNPVKALVANNKNMLDFFPRVQAYQQSFYKLQLLVEDVRDNLILNDDLNVTRKSKEMITTAAQTSVYGPDLFDKIQADASQNGDPVGAAWAQYASHEEVIAYYKKQSDPNRKWFGGLFNRGKSK